MLFYGTAWLVVVSIQRVCSLWQHYYGRRQITTYDGYPALALLLVPFTGENAAKLLVDPVLVSAAGFAMAMASEGLGRFLMLGAIAIPIKRSIELAIERASDDAGGDVQIRMRQQAERMGGR
jgi:hypothetical protein